MCYLNARPLRKVAARAEVRPYGKFPTGFSQTRWAQVAGSRAARLLGSRAQQGARPDLSHPWEDLEGGGYTIEVPELPGCITEADTLVEAKRMARDAIQAWLDAAAPQSAHRRAHSR
jgi:predicted RNase H-like HicB family nuclease